MMQKFQNAGLCDVRLKDPVFAPRQEACIKSTIPASIAKTVETGRIQAFDMTWKPGMPNMPHIFWDSDTAKVLEGMAYSLALQPDPELEKTYDNWVDRICGAQQPDGYLNTHFTLVEPDKRFTDLASCHELYCAGHLMEAAVAGYEALGKTKLLDCLCRYADFLAATFGNEPGKRRGWPGHEEIELALAKMYRVTKKESYLKLLTYFIDDRGTKPNFFEQEGHGWACSGEQAEVPVRDQQTATGHAVRQMYLLCGMADSAMLNDDKTLLEACERVYQNVVTRRMFVTGGVGSTFSGEAFTCDYDLTNGSMMYAESCATMGLALFSIRMYNITGDMKYLDTAERCLYNGILSGISLKGDTFFYTNYLEVDENLKIYNAGNKERQPWFGCSCCPTSFSRFLPQLGKFIWSVSAETQTISLNIPAANHAELCPGDRKIVLDVAGNYPYDGKIKIMIGTAGKFTLKLRIPSWCRKSEVKVNGAAASAELTRDWKPGDVVELDLELPVEFVYSNPKITTNAGRVALMRGPVVYALEEVDQACPVREMVLRKTEPVKLVSAAELQSGMIAIEGSAWRESFPADDLYMTQAPTRTAVKFRAIPYAAWQNRGPANMAVWMRAE